MLHREIFSVTENSLPARGGGTPPKSSFFTGATVARPEIWTAKDFRDPLRQKTEKIRPFWRGKVAVYRLKSDFKKPVSTDFGRLRVQNFGQISRIWTCF